LKALGGWWWGGNEGGRLVVSLLFKARKAKCKGVGVIMNAIDFSLCLRNFFSKLFQPRVVVGIKAVSAFSLPYGNNLQIPSVFGKWRL